MFHTDLNRMKNERYNRKMSEIIKFDNALLINVVSGTHFFTKHEMHINVKGKG